MSKIKPKECQNVEFKTSWNDKYLEWGLRLRKCAGCHNQETLFTRHSSKPRNRNIANAFFKAGFIDTWGRGFQKTRDGFEPAGIPMSEVENFCGGVRVTIQRTKFMKMMNVSSDVVSLSVDSRTVQRDLADLQKKGVLIREGNTSAGHWIWVGTTADNSK